MFDMPPPRTMTSGSRTLMTLASARAIRVLVALQRRLGRASPARGARRRSSGRRSSRRPASRCVVARQARARTETSRCSRGARSSTPGPGRSSSSGHGSGLWPHSPAMAFGAGQHLPVARRCPPPVPVPTMTPNTTSAPGGGAVGGLGDGKAVRVVGDAHVAAEARPRDRRAAAGRSARRSWRS